MSVPSPMRRSSVDSHRAFIIPLIERACDPSRRCPISLGKCHRRLCGLHDWRYACAHHGGRFNDDHRLGYSRARWQTSRPVEGARNFEHLNARTIDRNIQGPAKAPSKSIHLVFDLDSAFLHFAEEYVGRHIAFLQDGATFCDYSGSEHL